MIKIRLKKRSKLKEAAKLKEAITNGAESEEKPQTRGRQIKIITGSTPPTTCETDKNPFRSHTEDEITYTPGDKTIRIGEGKYTKATSLLKYFQDMREKGTMQDLTLIVNGESIPAHRTILAASSKYFRNALRGYTPDMQHMTHVMTGVDVPSVNLCLDFIYSGKLSIAIKSMEGLLEAAFIMQLKQLVIACFNHLEKQIKNPRNSVITAMIMLRFTNGRTEKLVKDYIQSHFFDVMATEEFLLLTENKLSKYLVEYSTDDDAALRAMIAWINHNVEERSDCIGNLVTMFTFETFPTDYFLNEIMIEPLVTKNLVCSELLLVGIFDNVMKLKENLTVSNCFNLRKMAKKYKYAFRDCYEAIHIFMIDHFDQISVKDEFVSMAEDDIISLFSSTSENECFASEKFKWFAALKWVKYAPQREALFATILNTIGFFKLSKKFIDEVVLKEPMIKESKKYTKIINNSIRSSVQKSDNYIAVLIPDDDIQTFDCSYKSLPMIPGVAELEKSEIFELNNKLCLLTPKRVFYLGRDDVWMYRTEVDDMWLSTYYQVAATDDRMYFVGKNQLSFYDVLKDSWTCGLLGPQLESQFCVVTYGEFIFAFGAKEAKKYHMLNHIWSNIEHPGKDISNSSAVQFKSDIFIASSANGKYYRYNPVLDSWIIFKDSPIVADATESHAFVANNQLLLLCKIFTTVTLFSYDENSNTWLKIIDVPKFRKPSSDLSITKSKSEFVPTLSGPLLLVGNSDANNNSSSALKNTTKQKSLFTPFSEKSSNGLFVSLPNTLLGFVAPTNTNGRPTTVMSACMFVKHPNSAMQTTSHLELLY